MPRGASADRLMAVNISAQAATGGLYSFRSWYAGRLTAAIGLAVLRYRLYEIDVLLSRAIVYGLLSAALAGLYLGVAAVADGWLGLSRGLSVPILATATAAAVLLPVRGQLQRWVVRLFSGDRGAPYAAVARLGRRVEEATTAEPVLNSVVTVVAGSLREEERRRLRRDLHDGLGPTMAALTLGLETACMMAAGCRQQKDLLHSLKAETQRAVTDLRRIVYGLRPPALDELGLAGALREEVARLDRQAAGLSIALHIPGGDLAGLPAAVEVAAYRIVTEAVTNVLRHARARRCQIRIQPGPDLRLEVCDDGAGMPGGWRAGVGITAMRERAAELGGELAIGPASPRGTRISARLPITRPP